MIDFQPQVQKNKIVSVFQFGNIIANSIVWKLCSKCDNLDSKGFASMYAVSSSIQLVILVFEMTDTE